MVPVSVYLQTSPDEFRPLFQRQFYTVPSVGSFVRVFMGQRQDVYVVREVFHDFIVRASGPMPQPISIVVSLPDDDEHATSQASSENRSTPEWATEVANTDPDVPQRPPRF